MADQLPTADVQDDSEATALAALRMAALASFEASAEDRQRHLADLSELERKALAFEEKEGIPCLSYVAWFNLNPTGTVAAAARHFGCSRQQIYRAIRGAGVADNVLPPSVGRKRDEKAKADRRPYHCGTCGERGHSVLRCPQRQAPLAAA